MGVLGEPLERPAQFRVSGIPHSKRHIAQKSRVFCTPDRRPAKDPAKFVLAHFSQIGEPARRTAWCEGGFVGLGRSPVPGADLLADIAAEDQVLASFR